MSDRFLKNEIQSHPAKYYKERRLGSPWQRALAAGSLVGALGASAIDEAPIREELSTHATPLSEAHDELPSSRGGQYDRWRRLQQGYVQPSLEERAFDADRQEVGKAVADEVIHSRAYRQFFGRTREFHRFLEARAHAKIHVFGIGERGGLAASARENVLARIEERCRQLIGRHGIRALSRQVAEEIIQLEALVELANGSNLALEAGRGDLSVLYIRQMQRDQRLYSGFSQWVRLIDQIDRMGFNAANADIALCWPHMREDERLALYLDIRHLQSVIRERQGDTQVTSESVRLEDEQRALERLSQRWGAERGL